MPITFSTILREAGIDPSAVHLVRHQKAGSRATPYRLWRTDRAAFELYQSIQSRPVFRVGNVVASFVAPSQNDTLFVGCYRVAAVGAMPPGRFDPIGGHSVDHCNLYDLTPDPRLDEYVGKLRIEWGKGYVAWVQRAHKSVKPVVEIRGAEFDPPFPTYLHFIANLSEIEGLHDTWKDRLREARGVYVLTCPKSCELYVGSATGEGGFYERWCQHAARSGDAAKFRTREPQDYRVAILEVAGSNSSPDDIVRAEHLWMAKLQTNEMGLNGGLIPTAKASSASQPEWRVAHSRSSAPAP